MTDPANLSSSMLSQRARPPMPQGPRFRNRSSQASVVTASVSSRDSTVFTNYSPTLLSPSSPSSFKSENQPLSPISEQPSHDSPAVSIDTKPGSQQPPRSPSPPPSIKPVPKPSILIAPPRIEFESVPIQWKALPLEAAVWTFSSQELQEIVSRAIRSSARESFIRLVSIEALDEHLPAELERLDRLKMMAQARYRFCVHRRTMLLQGLQLCANPLPSHDQKTSSTNVGQLTAQLSETTAECDRLLEELIRVADQQAQIIKLQDGHWASALAVALRKLNGSYAKRTADLQAARSKIKHLEAELEDAWKEAEKMALEIDGNEEVIESDDDDDLDEEDASLVMAEHIRILTSPVSTHHVPPSIPQQDISAIEANISVQAPERSSFPEPQPSPVQHSELRPVPVNIPVDLTMEDAYDTQPNTNIVSDTATIHSNRSTRSAKSTRSIKSTKSVRGCEPSRMSQVSAARRRSIRTSLGSLRFPSLRNKLSSSKPPPPMPDLPKDFAAHLNVNSDAGAGMRTPHPLNLSLPGARAGDPSLRTPLRTPLRGSIDDIQVVPRSPKMSTPKKKTMDDIDLRPGRSMLDPAVVALEAEHDIPLDDFANEALPEQRDKKISDAGRSDASATSRAQSVVQAIQSRSSAFRLSSDRFSLKIRSHSKNSPGGTPHTSRSRYSLSFPLFTGSGSKPPSRRPLSAQCNDSS